jgi:hypothetical protein
MTKNKNPTLRITRSMLQWVHTEQNLAYPIFIRDPAQQRAFLGQAPPQSTITLHIDKDLCQPEAHQFLGQTFTQNTPEKILIITLQDIFTRHGYRIGKICEGNTPLYHWSSLILGCFFWGIGSVFAIMGLYLQATAPAPQPLTLPKTPSHHATIPPLLLGQFVKLPGAIERLAITPTTGHIRAYIPRESQDRFGQYIQHLDTQFAFQWQHRLVGQTRDALVWEGQWQR